MFAPRILLWAALGGALLTAGPITRSDKIKEAAKSDAEREADAHAASSRAAEAALEAAAAAEAAKAKAADFAAELARRHRWNGLLVNLALFALAFSVGLAVLSKVPAKLHTPLLSVSNTLGGVVLVGALVVAGLGAGLSFREGFGSFIGMLAVALATMSVVGGFLITHRMLVMLQRK